MLKLVVPEDVNFRITPRSVCALYLMLKLHFSGDYDVKKYNWKYAISEASFNQRRDKKFFENIAYKYMIHDLTYIFVCALLNKTDNWIGGMTSEHAITQYRIYDTMLKTYTREFQKDLGIMAVYCQRENITFGDLIKYDKSRDSSRIIMLLSRNIIKYETFIILDRFFNLIDKYDKQCFDYEWMSYSVVLKAYRSLLLIDVEVFLNILIKVFNEKFNIDLEKNRENLIKISEIIGKEYDIIE